MIMSAFRPARDTIFACLGGSHAHGTARDTSDVDVRGVGVAPLANRLSFAGPFEQYEGDLPTGWDGPLQEMLSQRSHPRPDKVECVVFEISKFARLCAAANPNAMTASYIKALADDQGLGLAKLSGVSSSA